MLIKNDFEVSAPLETVWDLFGDVPQVAACLPGADIDEQVGEDRYRGNVAIGLGPVTLDFDGTAEIKERNEDDNTIVVDASGADKKGRGQAALQLNAALTRTSTGTNVDVTLDLQLSGPAAQYGRGLVSDVTVVLLDDFATNLQRRVDAIQRGLDPDTATNVKPASGFAIGFRAARMALARVFRRFFLPYRPQNA